MPVPCSGPAPQVDDHRPQSEVGRSYVSAAACVEKTVASEFDLRRRHRASPQPSALRFNYYTHMASRPFRSPVLPWLGSGVTKHSQSPTNQPNPKRGVKKQTRSPSWILARNDCCLLYPWLLDVLSSLFPFLVASGCLLLIRGSSSAAESSSLLTRFLRIPFVSRPSFPSSDL